MKVFLGIVPIGVVAHLPILVRFWMYWSFMFFQLNNSIVLSCQSDRVDDMAIAFPKT